MDKQTTQDLFDFWHLNYEGDKSLAEFMSEHANWSPMDFAEWELTGNIPVAEG